MNIKIIVNNVLDALLLRRLGEDSVKFRLILVVVVLVLALYSVKVAC